ncbi:hypothetical protein [Stenotrophomonas acidaminiphila]|uniref:hypothetical protein n=1 Tax=Stenotrophomonas acidaminiphila TaxID=128780 RepID=UPI0028A7FA0F|nr:hypothetical protein [Stenotrophomonas acidaminiphila]
MPAVVRYNRRTLPAELRNMEAWPQFDSTALDPEALAVWKRRRDAVIAYLGGMSVAQIQARYGYQCHQVVRYLNQCVRLMHDGSCAGWIGLVKGIRTEAHVRRRPLKSMPHLSRGGYAGALEYTFSALPGLKTALDKYLATGVDPWGEDRGRVTPRTTHQVFLRLCTEAGIAPFAWPFCVERQARNSIAKYARSFFEHNHQRVALLQYGEVSRDRSKRGKSPLAKLEVKAPFEVVEADEHEVHLIISIGIETPKGVRHVPCRRLTLIVVVDRFTSYILAWDLVVRRQISSEDFLQCIDKAIAGQCLSADTKEAMNVCIGVMANPSDGTRLGFDSLFIDNALAHLSDSVCDKVRKEAGAAVSFGAIKRPERRHLVERVFCWMARELFHRSRATTGNSSVDTRRVNPEREAVRRKISMGQLMRAMDDAVTRWNGTPTEANYGCSPSEQLLDYYSNTSGALPPLCPPQHCESFPLRVEIYCPTVRGSKAKGRLPYVTYASVEYSSEQLAARWDLLGKKIRLHIDPYDISRVHAYTAEGEDLGELVPISSRWRYPHSREMRKLLKAKIKYAHDRMDHDPAKAFLAEQEHAALEANAKSPRVTQAASIVAEEARKGYSSRQSTADDGTQNHDSTRQLVRRVRNPGIIDFSVIGRT